MASSTASKRFAILALFACGSLARVAHADAPRTDPQLAQSLFDKGRELMIARRYTEACPQFQESQRLDPGGGTLLNLALCHEAEGKTATAHAELNEALNQAIHDRRKDREKLSRERLAVLAPKLSRLTVTVAEGAEVRAFELSIDGIPLRREAWGVTTVIDPGTHKVDASAPGYRAWSAIVIIDEPADNKSLVVPALVQEAPVSSAPPPPAVKVEPSPSPPPGGDKWVDVKTAHSSSWRYVVGGLTLASYGASVITGVLALNAHATVKNDCVPDRQFCTNQDGRDAAAQAKTMAWVSTITLGAGVVGTFAYFFWPTETVTRRATVGAIPLPGGAALSVSGTLE